MLKCLRVPVEKLKAKEIDSVKKRVTCLAWELGRTPPSADIKAALAQAFERHMGITLVPGGLTAEEEDMGLQAEFRKTCCSTLLGNGSAGWTA